MPGLEGLIEPEALDGWPRHLKTHGAAKELMNVVLVIAWAYHKKMGWASFHTPLSLKKWPDTAFA